MSNEAREPLVKIPDGIIRGRLVTSVLGYVYFSFQGIPYAQPPVGSLRFKPPQSVEPWMSERAALAPGPNAPAMDIVQSVFLENSNEDCLYLNVYTRDLQDTNKTIKKPVMFFIHGGCFTFGSGSDDMYGPDYLLAKDVVLVTINYRLGALGFLSLQSEACPGNNGLRDQVEALRWVKRSITAFGGDENDVTIFGESAGGASVQYLMLSQLSRGLFHKAICQSASSLSPILFLEQPIRPAFALGRALGFNGTKRDELLEFLRGVPARDIVEKSEGVRKAVFPHWHYVPYTFLPVVEPSSPDAFLDSHPEELLSRGRVHDVPYMTGVLDLEGVILVDAKKGVEILETKEELERLLPPLQTIEAGRELADFIIDKVKSFYFSKGFDRENFLKVLSWIYLVEGFDESSRRIVNIPERKSKTYVYHFTHDGGVSLVKAIWGLTDLNVCGIKWDDQHSLRIMSARAPLVKTVEGLLRGRIVKSVLGDSYFSFQGIPYAQPPVGPLRFKPPKQVQPWTGERSALEHGPTAPALFLGFKHYLETSDEDCLYLNVYTTKLPDGENAIKKPVLFWIHGGGFLMGSGNSDIYGPDYLLRKDIVLVTINYRLGALGFLSLQSSACPGNNGLRDMVEALRWVRRNISTFGGDENNVTIFGESAGGAAVQYLMLSKQSRGLFHRAISQSGSVLNPWAHSRNPKKCAFELGKSLGFTGTNDNDLLNFLTTLPAEDIVQKSVGILKAVEPFSYFLGGAFAPVVEPASEDAFLDTSPDELLQRGDVHDVPYMLGVLTLEGPILLKAGKTIETLQTKKEWDRLLSPHRDVQMGTPLAESIVEEIKRFYFPTGFDKDKFLDVLSWEYFLAGNNEALRGISNNPNRKSNIYFYQFTHDVGSSFMKILSGMEDLKGTFHGDELSFLFYLHIVRPDVEEGTTNAKVIDAMTQMWTDFARTGEPTPNSQIWKSFKKNDESYLEIGSSQVLRNDFCEAETKFWAHIHEKIRNNKTANKL